MSEDKKAKGAVALADQYTQNDVPGLLESVNKQITRLTKGLAGEAKTTGDLPGFGKIKGLNTVSQLIMAHSSVVNRADAYKKSAKAILPEGIKMPPFKIAGSTAQEWVDDIQGRVVEVAHKAKLDKLKKTKKILEDNLSAEAKLAKDLAAIAGDLADDIIE